MGFNDDRNLYFARKRDRLRAKLSVGKRIQAKLEADRIVDKHIEMKKKSEEKHDRESVKSVWDDAMQTTHLDIKGRGELRKLII